MRMRVLIPLLVTTAVTATAFVGTAATAAPSSQTTSSQTTASPSSWSTAPHKVTRTPATAPQVTGIRVGHHARFDRVVIDLDGAAPGYAVRYVRTLHRDPSGRAVNLLGPVSLRIVLNPANGHDPNTGASTMTTPRRTKWRLDQVRETAVIGDFEAVFMVGVGLASKEPFRVRTLHNPTRIVVDVRH